MPAPTNAISELPLATPLDGSELVVLVQDDTTKRASLGDHIASITDPIVAEVSAAGALAVAAADAAAGLLDAVASPAAGIYSTKALLQAALLAATLTANAYYIVITDETAKGARTQYQFLSEATYTTGLIATGKLKFIARLGGGELPPAGFPQGVTGYWRARDYATAVDGLPTKVIPNLATSVAPEPLLSRLPTGAFKYTGAQAKQWFASPNSAALIVTDNAEIGPYGEATAGSVVGTGGAQYIVANGQSIPAGTNAFAVWLRSRTGANQNLRLTGNAGGAYQAIVVTPEWQRFQVSWTDGADRASGLRICNDGAAAWDVAVDYAKCYSGGVAPADKPLAGHLYFGMGNAATDAPPVAAGWIDLTSGGVALANFLQGISSRELTISMLVRADITTYQNNYLLVDNLAQSNHGILDVRSSANDTENNFKGSLDGKGVVKGLLNSRKIAGRGSHVITLVVRSNKVFTYIDDVQMSVSMFNASPAETILRLWRLGTANAGLFNNYKVNQILLARRAFNPAEVRQTYKAMLPCAALDGISVVPPEKVVCFEGDSLPSFDSNNNSWCDLYLAGAASDTWVQRRSIGGSECATNSITMTARAADVDDILPPAADRIGRKFILHTHIGTNDMAGISDTAFMANYTAYLAARKAAGWKLVANTLLARNGLAAYNTRRDAANIAIRGLVPASIDAVADLAANATIGTEAAMANPTYSADGTHLTAAGHAIAAPLIAPAIDSL